MTRQSITRIFLLLAIPWFLAACGGGGSSESVKLTAIELTPDSSLIDKDDTIQFKAVGFYSDGTDQDITGDVAWTSSSLTVVQISNQDPTKGLATGIKTGTSTISAKLSGVTGTATVSVIDPQAIPPAVKGVLINPSAGKVVLTWQAAYRATSYTIYWALEEGVTTQTGQAISDVRTLTYTYEGLESGATFYCIITASNANGESPPSAEVRCKPDPDIDLSFFRPAKGLLIDRELDIFAAHRATYQMTGVSAEVEGREVQLVYETEINGDYVRTGWMGTLDLQGLDMGPKTLVVTARDIFGHVSQASVVCVYDQKPVIRIDEPLNFTVARPELDVSFSCADDDPRGCQQVKVYTASDSSNPLATGTDRIDQVIGLGAQNGKSIELTFSAKDWAGQTVTQKRTVYVESSPRLVDEEPVNGKIWDLSQDRILYLDTTTGRNTLTVRNRMNDVETRIMDDQGKIPQYGFLSPKGSIFVEQSGNVLTSLVYDWRDGNLVDLGGLNSSRSLKVKGDYAIWNIYPTQDLVLRDLISGINTTVSTTAGNTMNDVASNGDVVFWTSGQEYQTYRYRDGQTTRLSNDAPVWNTYPLTDGFNAVYRKRTDEGLDTLALFTDAGEEILCPEPHMNYTPYQNYDLNNRWVAFTRPGLDDVFQVWRRSPAGELRQLSFFGSASRIGALGPNGEVVWISGGTMYLSRTGQSDLQVGSSLGRALFLGDQLYLVIGRSAFRVSLQ